MAGRINHNYWRDPYCQNKKRLLISIVCIIGLIVQTGIAKGNNIRSAYNGRQLTFLERASCQKAIERVYWQNRIWPKENPQAKPSFEQMMSDESLRAKVEDSVRKSNALELYWTQPLTGKQLQAEMERMAKNTKQPKVLKQLWNALNNDPYLIAECLVRPVLADRFIRNWFAFDERFHGETKRKAEANMQHYGGMYSLESISGTYSEIVWIKTDSGAKAQQEEKIKRSDAGKIIGLSND